MLSFLQTAKYFFELTNWFIVYMYFNRTKQIAQIMELPKVKLPAKLPFSFGKKKKARKVAALDIGSFGVKLIEVLFDEKDNATLVKTGFRPIAVGTIVDKDIRDREGLVFAIQNLVDEVDPEITEVGFSLAGHKVLVDRVQVPMPTGKGNRENQIREAVMVEAEQRIPTGIDSVQLDFVELGPTEDGKRINVLLIAARNELVEDYLAVVMDAGLVPVVIDLDSIALYNAFEFNHGVPQEGGVALINVGHSLTNMAFILNGSLFSVRDISNAARSVWDRLQTELHLSTDDLKELMVGNIPLEESPSTRRAVSNATEDLGIGIGMAFSYFENMTSGAKIEKVYMSGGAVGIPFLVDSLAQKLSLPIELINSFGKIKFDRSMFEGKNLDLVKGINTVGIGVAIRTKEIV